MLLVKVMIMIAIEMRVFDIDYSDCTHAHSIKTGQN